MPRLDEAGRDTELARYLHGRGRLDRQTLEGLLTEARRARPGGGTLARAIVQRGLLSEPEVEASLQQLAAGAAYPARPSGRFDTVPPPSSGSLPAVAGPGPRPSGSYQATGSGVANTLVGPKSGRMQRSSGRFGTLMQGLTLGAYRVLEPLGAGAMGQVFLAEHVETGSRYAVKTLLSTADPAFIARFLREGEAQAKVDSHPHVLRVHAMGEARGLHYLITELASGGDLKEVLRKQERLPAEGAARLARDLARGLAHMHTQGVLHRDLKPANILFDANGVAKLADFGLARFEGAQSLTHTGDLVGTPVYMPPEQAMGLRDQVGPASDVYGLAAITYHCIAGRPPFEGATTIEVVDKLTNQAAPPLTSLAPDTPPKLAQLVHAGLSKDAAQRPTAAAWAQELDAFLAPPPRETVAAAKGTARGPLRVLIAGAVLSALLALGVVGALLLRRESPGELSAAPGPSSAPDSAGAPATTPTPEATAAPTPPPPGFVWPVGVERRYLLELRMHGEFPTMGWTAMMANGQGQQTMRFQRTYGLKLWHQPLEDDDAAVVATATPTETSEEDPDDEEWEDDHDDWDVGDAGEPAPEPGVIRLRAQIESFALNWVALGMSKAFDSREVAQDEDGRRYGEVVGQEFTLGMRPSGEVVWVRGTEAIQEAIYRVGRQESGDARPNPMAGMRTRMTYHVPELVGSVMRQTLNTFFHVLRADGELQDGQAYDRLLPAPWSVGSGWGMGRGRERERNQLAAPSIPCRVTVRDSREGAYTLSWSGDNQELVAEALAQGEVLLHRKARGRASVDQGVLLRSELQRDAFSGEFQVESSWGGDGSPQVRRIKGEQEGRLELLPD